MSNAAEIDNSRIDDDGNPVFFDAPDRMFTVCVIVKDEEKNIPALAEQLKGFKHVVLDTGSTDKTVELAKSLGLNIHPARDAKRFESRVTEDEAAAISCPLVKAGDRVFDFSAARNEVASMAETDWIVSLDADERLQIDANMMEKIMLKPAVRAIRCLLRSGDKTWNNVRVFNRRRVKWNSLCHEYVTPVKLTVTVQEPVMKITHRYRPKEERSMRIAAIALQALRDPSPRHLYYWGRELIYNGLLRDAINVLSRHVLIETDAWQKSQALAMIGSAWLDLGDVERARIYWEACAAASPGRRIGYLRLAQEARDREDWEGVAKWAGLAAALGRSDSQESDLDFNESANVMLYCAFWRLDKKKKAKEQWLKARQLNPGNPQVLIDAGYFRPKPKPVPKIIHHIWVGPKPAPMKWIKTWYAKHPGWKHVLWDNEAVFGRKWRNQKIVDFYRSKGVWHGVADVVRYEILYEYGGFMPGADSVCLRPVDGLFEDAFDAWAVFENEKVRPGLITPLYACRKGADFALKLVEGLGKKQIIGVPWLTTGNLYMKEMVEGLDDPLVRVFPSWYFNPVHYTGEAYKGDFKPYSRQLWGTTLGKYNQGI